MVATLIVAMPGLVIDAHAATPIAGSRPNIVVILADDLGYGDLGCYNPQSKIPTPNIDRLSTQGIRFTDAHVAAAICSPSRYGLLTGQYPWRTRPGGSALGTWAAPIIAKDRLTLPAMLQQAGYATACIGKWHLGWEWPTTDGKPVTTGADTLGNLDFSKPILAGPTTHGFDYYFGTDVPNFPPYCFIENDRTVGLPSAPTGEYEFPGPKLPGWNRVEILPELTRRAVRYIEEAARDDRPFFLYFSLTSPHNPILPTKEFRGKSGAGDYGDFVMQTDWTVGQVMAALERANIAERTLLVFTSDNGPAGGIGRYSADTPPVYIGAYERIRTSGHASMASLRGTKGDAWEGGHRVPFLARWPERIAAGSASSELLCLTDMMATCAALVGAKVPASAGEDSYDALPALLGGKARRPSAVLASGKLPLAVRQGDWVWVDSPMPLYGQEPPWYKEARGYGPSPQAAQLYNLSNDQAQSYDRSAENPDKAEELRVLLTAIKAAGRSPDLGR